MLLNNIEKALAARINGASLGLPVFLGQDGADQENTSVTVYAQQGEEVLVGIGAYKTTCVVQVRSDASQSSIEQHRQRCDDVFGLIKVDGIGGILSGLADLTVYDPIVNEQRSHGREDDSWLSELRFDALCCTLDVA